MTESNMDIEEQAVRGVVVAGVGEFGRQAVQSMAERGISGEEFAWGCRCGRVDFAWIDEDGGELRICPDADTLRLSGKLPGGHGLDGEHAIVCEAAKESFSCVRHAFKGAGMVVLVCGLDWDAGTGAIPVAARVAKEAGALVAALAVMPFTFKGAKRAGIARDSMAELAREADCFAIFPGDRLLAMTALQAACRASSLKAPLHRAIDALYAMVRDIAILYTTPKGYLCLAQADMKRCLAGTGRMFMAMGTGRGRERAAKAARDALAGSLMEDIAPGSAETVLYAVFAPDDISGEEIETIAELVQGWASCEGDIFYNVYFDDSLEVEDEIRVTLIACGIGQDGPAS